MKHIDEEYRALMKEWEISFDGPIQPSSWPAEYAKRFQVIRNISRIWFDEYSQSLKFDKLSVADKKARIRALVISARYCRENGVEESTWRTETENKVVARFSAELVW